MNINELFKTLIKHRANDADEAFAAEFGYYGEYPEAFYAEDTPLKIYYHQDASWVCTDTLVGLAFLFFKDEFVGVSLQEGRKSDTHYYWKDDESFNKVKAWVDEVILKERLLSPEKIDFEQDMSSWAESKKWHDEWWEKELARWQKKN